jgi:hypothetical protein
MNQELKNRAFFLMAILTGVTTEFLESEMENDRLNTYWVQKTADVVEWHIRELHVKGVSASDEIEILKWLLSKV